ncbi:MAG: sulfite exporter TauE/SafE family protein, partial [Candidatus Latescibacterota bacterium]
MAEFSYDAVLLISGVILVAASLQGITGFGFNMLAVPALILVYSPQVVVPGVIMSFIPLGLLQTLLMWRLIDFRIWG